VARSIGLILAMLFVAIGVAACGDAGDGSGGTSSPAAAATRTQPPAADVNDVTRAKRALVSLVDVPKGWREDDGTVTRLRCGSFDPYESATAVMRSKRLTHARSGVQERIALYADDAAARRGLTRLDSPTAAACLRREVRRRVSEEAGGPATPAELVRVDRLGPAAHARRYVSSSISSYGKVVGYIDAVHLRVGRAVGALVFVSGPTPPDESLYDDVVDAVSRRLQATLR
jgi:hypothetical protein